MAALYQQEHRRNLRHNPDTKRNLYHSAECVGGIRSKPYYSGADTPLSAGHIRTDDFLADAPHGQIFSEHDGSAPLSVVWVLYSLLFIPLLSVWVARSLGKPQDYRIPFSKWLFYLTAGLLLLLVLTNDLHQWVFTFPDAGLSDDAYSYGPGYYVVAAWEILCAAAAMGMILLKCRLPHSQNVSLSAADSVCPFFGILLCLCDQNSLGLGIGR